MKLTDAEWKSKYNQCVELLNKLDANINKVTIRHDKEIARRKEVGENY